MFSSLFPGAAAESAAPTWLPEQTGASGDAGQSEVPADNVFGDLLAATIDLAKAPAGAGGEAMQVPVVPLPTDLWLTELLAVSRITGDAETLGATEADAASSLPAGKAEAAVDLDEAAQDVTTIAWAIPVPVPIPTPIQLSPVQMPVEAEPDAARTPAQPALAPEAAPIPAAPIRAETPVANKVDDPSVGADLKVGPYDTVDPYNAPADVKAAPEVTQRGAVLREALRREKTVPQPVAAEPASSVIEQPVEGVNVEEAAASQPAPRNSVAMPRASFRLKAEATGDKAAETATPSRTSAVAAAPVDQVPQNVAVEASAPLPKASEIGAKTTEAAAFAQRLAGASPVAVDVSNEGGESAADSGARQASNSAAREFLAANRASESSQGSPAAPIFSVAAAEPALRPAPVQAVAATTPLAPPQQEAENVTRLVESMRVQWRQGVPEATVRLKPEHLGEVTISIKVERGVVSAVVHAETPAVQQWLESQEGKLRSGLADQGLSLERFVVRERQEERREQREQRQQQPPPRYRQPREEGRRFEVTA